MEDLGPDAISASDLGEMRRELLRILNAVDPQPDRTRREDVCQRIQRLCREGVIPEPIGDFMHVVRKCRNRAEYQDQVPKGKEARAIRSAWDVIEEWWLNLMRHAPRKAASWSVAEEATA